jgi:hypothetical protein
MLRVLLGAVEAANVAEHLWRMSGADTPPPFLLGRLDTAWMWGNPRTRPPANRMSERTPGTSLSSRNNQ